MSLENTLSGLLRGQISALETDALIRAAIAHARNYVRWLMWNRNYTIVPLGMSIDDIAIDTIAELLSEIDGEQMERLRSAVRSVASGTEPEITLECAFKAVVLRTVRLNLARIFMEMHPVRARLLRSLRRFAKESAVVTRHDGIAGYWYSLAGMDARLELPAAPPDALQGMLVPPRLSVQPAPMILTALLDALSAFPELRQAVSEDDVLDITLRLLQTDQEAATPVMEEADQQWDTHPLEAEALEALTSLHGWIANAYVAKGKLDEEEASALLIAAERYIRDLARSEDRGHFSYLRPLLPGLSYERYRAEYRSIYEYILRTVFTTTRKRLQLFIDDSEDSVH